MAMTDNLQRLAAGAVLALAIGYILHIGRGILIPLVLGLFIAYVFWTVVAWVRNAPVIGRRLPDWLAHVGALVLITLVIWGLVLMVIQNIAMVERQLPTYRANLEGLIEQVAGLLGLEDVPTFSQLGDEIVARVDLGRVVGGAVGIVSALIGNLIVVFVYTAFIMIERLALVTKLERLTGSAEGGRRMAKALGEISGRIGRYLSLKAFVSAIVGAGSWVIMRLIGIDYAEFWAVLIFVFNFIPYVGSFFAVLLPVMLTLVQFGAIGPFLVALVSLTGVQLVVGNFLEPRLMGRSLNLSPIVILLALAAWSSLWGVVGAFLCVPITVIMLIVFSEFQTTRPLAILLSQDGRIDPEEQAEGT
ncbi:MAG: AI-2E family transporter [Gammaproteobacteria bacterium]|nr:AI-2E family transporter [Gammaproteobacteria bacterium]